MSQSEYSGNTGDFLEGVSFWPDTKCCEEGSTVIPKILERLQKSSSMLDIVIPSVNILVDKFLASFFEQELGREILIQICPALSACFNDALCSLPSEAIKVSTLTLSSVMESLKSVTRVLQCLENVIRKMAPLISEDTRIHALHDVPTLTLDVLKKSYTHCKDSEKTYDTLFESSSNALSVLFQRSFSLQKSLSVFLSRLKYVQLGEDEVEHDSVLAICGTLVDICRIISALDSMLVGSIWKLLLRMLLEFKPLIMKGIHLSRYLEALADNILDSVRYTIQLATTSSHLLKTGEVATKKAYRQTCRISQFYLSSLQSLIAGYKIALRKDAIVVVCSMVVDLFAASKSALQITQDSFENPLLSMGEGDGLLKKIETIVKELSQAHEFMEAYQDFSIQDLKLDSRDRSFGILLFHLEMCKELVENRDEIKRPEIYYMTALDKVFKGACQAHEDLSFAFCGLHHPEKTTLYDFTVARCCCLILSSPSASLSCVDYVLKELFGYNSCRSILASDIIVLIAKHSPAARLNYCKAFLELLNSELSSVDTLVTSWPVLQVSLLLKRICSFLTHEQRELLVCKPPVISRVYFGTSESFLQSCGDVVEMVKLWNEGKATIKELDSELVPGLAFIKNYIHKNSSASVDKATEKEMISVSKAVEDLWLCISSVDGSLYNSLFFERLLVALIDLTLALVDSGRSMDMQKALSVLGSVCKNQYNPVLLRCRIAKVFRICQHTDMSEDAEAQLVELLSALVHDPHWMVRHEALCSFEALSRTTTGTAIIEHCRRSPELAAMLESHLSQTTRGQAIESSTCKCTSEVSAEKIKGLYASWISRREKICSALKPVELRFNHGSEMKLADALRKTIFDVEKFVSANDLPATSLFMKSVLESYKMLGTVFSDV